MTPAQAARVDEAYALRLTNVDLDSGIATLAYSYRVGEGSGSGFVRIHLLTAELSAPPSKPPTPPKAELVPSFGSPNTLRSPSGRFALEYVNGAPAKVILRNAKGEKLGVVSEAEVQGLANIVWSPSDDYFTFTGVISGAAEPKSGLYVYSVKQRKHQLVARGVRTVPQWSDDGRLLACLRTETEASKDLPESVQRSRGTVMVFDVGRGSKRVLAVGELAGKFALSPIGAGVVFTELVKDEYGDFDSYALRTADVRTGSVHDLLTNRREPVYAWAGDDALAVTTFDKYAVPTLNLVGAAGGRPTALVTARDFARFKPLAYLPMQRRVVYKASASVRDYDSPEELWAVEPGRRPVRLFPKNVRSRQ